MASRFCIHVEKVTRRIEEEPQWIYTSELGGLRTSEWHHGVVSMSMCVCVCVCVCDVTACLFEFH